MSDEARLSQTETQLLVQMVSDVRGLVQDMDRKLDRMVPRPEFEQYQLAVRERFAALDLRIGDKEGAHAAIQTRIEAADDKVDAIEKARNENYRSMNAKVWLAVLATVLASGSTLLLNALA